MAEIGVLCEGVPVGTATSKTAIYDLEPAIVLEEWIWVDSEQNPAYG